MSATYIENFLSISAVLTAAPVPRTGVRGPLYIAQETAAPISGDLTIVTSSTDVADLLAATQISAQAAEDLTAMFLQTRAPALVYVATYDHDAGSPETPDDALDRAILVNTVFGVIAQESRADADLEAVANWCNADGRKYRYLPVGQSDDAGLLTSGKPSGLADCEQPWSMVAYSADGEPTAAAYAGYLGGANLSTRGIKSTAKLAASGYINGCALPTVTSAQRAFALANDCLILNAMDAGSGASERIQEGKLTYGGASLTSVVSLVYMVDRVEAGIQALVSRLAARGEPLLTDTGGLGQVKQAVDAELADLTAAGHFRIGTDTAGVSLPDGFRSVVTATGSTINVSITALFALEATATTTDIYGEVA